MLSYVLNHAEVTTHGTENAIAMVDWLVSDPALGFRDTDQRRRLSTYLQAYAARLDPRPAEGTAQHAFRGRLEGWRHTLDR
ncbi:hypothetical protein [Nocardioides sp.]|uniref:hypothetical protein n=1 Tax=Nocardioides sp. TaxID=35761 RepID=UPI003D132C9A